MKKKAVLGIMVTLTVLIGLIGMFNAPVVAESIPTTEVFYGDGQMLFEQGIYVIATKNNPVQTYPNYKMLKEHVTTETSVGAFTSILVSQGISPTSGYGLEITSIEKIDYTFVLSANFIQPGWECVVLQVITNPIALIPIGNLPVGEYSITLHIDRYIRHCPSGTYEYIGTETWTETFIAIENLTPTAHFNYSPTFPYVGQTVTFDASGSSDIDGTIVSYVWDFGDGFTGTDVITTHTYESVGTFNVTLIVTDDLGATDTLQQEITVDPLPTLTITLNNIKKGSTETILLELVDDDYDGFITQDIHNHILSFIKRTHKTTTFNLPGTYTATKGAWKVTLQSRNDFTITLT